jgi:hypothetical protein
MGTAKDFFVACARLCKSPNWERWAEIAEWQFEKERLGGSKFDRTEADKRDPFNRLQTAFGFTAFRHDTGRATYCKILAELFVLAHYSIEHGEDGHEGRIKSLLAEAGSYKDKYPDIDEYMTAEKAASDGGWI